MITLSLSGLSGVGKTSFAQRLVDEEYSYSILPNTGRYFYVKEIEDVTCKIIDMDYAKDINNYNYSFSHTDYILCYDVTCAKSFCAVKDHKHILDDKGFKNVILIGMKSDLKNRRYIDLEEGKELADKLGVPFFECSSLEGVMVDCHGNLRSFDEPLKYLYRKKYPVVETPVKKENSCYLV